METRDRNTETVAFNIHAELYENDRGDLAVRLEGDKIFRNVGTAGEGNFIDDAQKMIREGQVPDGWAEMSPRELTYAPGWQHVSSMGYLDGEFDRPAMELEVRAEELGAAARRYIGDLVS